LIQAQRGLVELYLRMDRQVCASRELLPQQEIRVFVGAALPGTLRITEVDLNIRRYCKDGENEKEAAATPRRMRAWPINGLGHCCTPSLAAVPVSGFQETVLYSA
jgi:hypothetical protein